MDTELKKALRRQMLKHRAELSTEERSRSSNAIVDRFVDTDFYREATTLMAYVSMPDELQLGTFFDRAFSDGKVLAIPLIVGRGTMRPVFLPSMNRLEIGDFGIMTVSKDARTFVEIGDIDCVIVPGAAFDRNGNRLGLGGGYYDRFLARVNHASKVALAFEWQIVDEVPTQPHDVKIDAIVTESEIINCGGK